MLGAAVLLAACANTDSRAGAIIVGLTGPQTARGVMFTAVGTIDTVTVPAGKGYHVYTSRGTADTMTVAIVAGAGNILTGTIALIQVPNRSHVPSFDVIQAASPSYVLLADSLFHLNVQPSVQ